jgi:hypothetical protein
MKRISKNVNHDYFSVIDTERKAYFLGLIYADGTIITPKEKTGKQRQKQLAIALQEEDGYILEEICKDIKPKKSINIANPPSVLNKGWKKRAVFKVSSNKICEDLISKGCLQNKSKVGMNFPELSLHLIKHFIRGFFDGDGCIYVKEVKNSYKRVTTYTLKKSFTPKLHKRIIFCSTSEKFLKDCLTYLDKELKLESKPQWKSKKRTQLVYLLSIEGKKDVEKIQTYFYNDATIFMKRKLNKFNMTISSQAVSTLTEGSETT